MTKKNFYIATGNRHKLREFQDLLKDFEIVVHGLDDLPDYQTPEESGKSFAENSRLKAKALFDHLSKIKIPFDYVLTDDSGLSCDDLDGEPGVHSSRYAGPLASTAENNAKLIAELQKLTHVTRAAHFTCVLSLLDHEGMEKQFEGHCEGLITFDPKGVQGFGYDPLFYLPEFNKTMAELAPVVKNEISHRGKAFQKLRGFLEPLLRRKNSTRP